MGEARPLRLRYTVPALADLAAILDYIATRSPQGAARVGARIQGIINLLCSIRGQACQPKIRLSTTPYPYVIFYECTDDEIIIHAIRHGARDPSGNPGAE